MIQYSSAIIGVGAAANSGGAKGGGHQIGYTHAQMYQRCRRVQLIAAADINPANLQAFQEKFSVPRGHGFPDHRQMLAELHPDIVSIATYVGLHRPMIEDCIRAGVKAIICEKPLLPSPADCAAVRQLVAQSKTKVIVAHPRRYRPAVQRIKQLITEGAIGQPRIFISAIPGWDLNEWGSHWFDLYRFINNDLPISWVMGQARVRSLRGYGHAMEDHAAAYFAFTNGVRGLIDGGLPMNGPDTISFLGAEGVIRMVGEEKLIIETKTGHTTEDFTAQPPLTWPDLRAKGESHPWLDLWDCMLQDLLAWTDGGPPPPVAFDTAVQSCEATLAAYLSAVRGDRIDLPFSPQDSAVSEYPLEMLARQTMH